METIRTMYEEVDNIIKRENLNKDEIKKRQKLPIQVQPCDVYFPGSDLLHLMLSRFMYIVTHGKNFL